MDPFPYLTLNLFCFSCAQRPTGLTHSVHILPHRHTETSDSNQLSHRSSLAPPLSPLAQWQGVLRAQERHLEGGQTCATAQPPSQGAQLLKRIQGSFTPSHCCSERASLPVCPSSALLLPLWDPAFHQDFPNQLLSIPGTHKIKDLQSWQMNGISAALLPFVAHDRHH